MRGPSLPRLQPVCALGLVHRAVGVGQTVAQRAAGRLGDSPTEPYRGHAVVADVEILQVVLDTLHARL
ncbi:MAG TPA: hypothetical protein PLP04_18515, partial [Bryobacteraceae bacterium]|nr:hypothetical protein [Bryobacteraceae bacterium]